MQLPIYVYVDFEFSKSSFDNTVSKINITYVSKGLVNISE